MKYALLLEALEKTTESVTSVGWWAGVGGLAGILGIAGFVLSLINWYRLKPDIFIANCHTLHGKRSDGYGLLDVTIEIGNAGASAVTLAIIRIYPRSGLDAEPPLHLRWPPLQQKWLIGPELPCRLDAADTKTWTVDIDGMIRQYRKREDWIVKVAWYGRRRVMPWKLFLRRSWMPLGAWRRSPYGRRVRVASSTFSARWTQI